MMCHMPPSKKVIVFMIILSFVAIFIIFPVPITLIPVIHAIPCPEGRVCRPNWVCCKYGCCTDNGIQLTPDVWHHERFAMPQGYTYWAIIFVVGLVVFSMCAIWYECCRSDDRPWPRRLFGCCFRGPTSEHDSAGSCYPPPHYSRCGSFHQAPPPYSEVTSKPDLYPLVITCGEGDNKSGGNYLMVHYFRNYVIRAPGSLSATSTAESLNSSFICNAANEANSTVPPPYSCASNYEEWRSVGPDRSLLRSVSSLTEPSPHAPPRSRTDQPALAPPNLQAAADASPDDTFRDSLITSPVQPMDSSSYLELELIDYDLFCDPGCRPRLGPSPPIQQSPSHNEETNVFDHDFERLRHLYSCPCPSPDTIACESPPQPTSPTQTSRDSTLRRSSDERRHRRPDTIKKNPKARKSSLYMPLTSAYSVRPSRVSPGSRVSSRSAPATPCGSLVPNLLALTQRMSASRHGSKSSKLEEECDHLLTDDNSAKTDHKF